MIHASCDRRRFLQLSACSALAVSPAARLLAQEKEGTFKIGACDWSIGGRQDISALDTAKRLGLDGVQVSFGKAGSTFDLRKAEVRDQYLQKCEQLNLEIASLGMGELNSTPYASDPDAEQWVVDCIDVMKRMNQRIVLLAFFSDGDIKGKPDQQKSVVNRLKKVAPLAEKAGLILGIESWLSAEEHLRILDAVGSPAVQVYYDVANMEHMGYDIYQEIKTLGKDRICQIHAKENGHLLGKGKVDFVRVKNVLAEIDWSGWLIIEGATIPGKTMEECYIWNCQYLRSVYSRSTHNDR